MHLLPFVTTAFAILYAAVMLLLCGLNRRWWKRRWVRRASVAVPVLFAVGVAAWALGEWRGWPWAVWLGAGSLSIIYVYLAGLLLALVVTGVLHSAESACDWARRRFQRGAPLAPERRRFLRASLAAVPALTAATSTSGVVGSVGPARIPLVPLRFPGLPLPLAGLRVLHLTDAHLGLYLQLADLEELLGRASAQRPDLVLVTGDLCDHLPAYGDALRLVEALRPPLGSFACLGNHEYFRGIQAIRREYDRSSVRLLVDQGAPLAVGGQPLYVAGVDDPRHMHEPASSAHLGPGVTRSQQDAPPQAFRILMSHRPQALDHAAPLGVDLVLAGHTHGFQLGFGGRSVFEPWMPGRYIWGRYQKGPTQLCTSAGIGLWFPFRLGCPPEAPVVVLEPA